MNKAILLALATVVASAGERLTLAQALELAGQMSPAIQVARLEMLEREATSMAVRAGYGPAVNLVVGASSQTSNLQGIGLAFPGISNRIGPYRIFNARPVLTQTVLDLSLIQEIRAARARSREAHYQAEATREATQFAVVQLYLQVLEAESLVRAAEARLRTAEALARQVADREQAGSASKLDLERATGEVANEQVRVTLARKDGEVLKTLLTNMIGLEAPVGGLEAVSTPDTLPNIEELLPQAYRDRPELKAIGLRTEGAGHQYQAARSQRMPKLAAAADYGLLGSGPQSSIGTYSASATLSIPLWTSGRIVAEERAALLRRQQSEAQGRQQRLQVAQEVRQAIVEVNAAREALQAAQRSTAAAREVFELTTLRVTSGLATSLDSVVAQGRLAEAEDQEIRTRYQLQLAQARTARARGNVVAFLER